VASGRWALWADADELERLRQLRAYQRKWPEPRYPQALTTPKELMNWWGADDVYRCTAWETDLRVGGRWRSEGKNADGRPFRVEGKFLEIDPPWKLSYTWEPSWEAWQNLPPTTVEIVLEQKSENKTQLRLTHRGFAGFPKALEEHQQGWPMVLGWLKSYAEKR